LNRDSIFTRADSIASDSISDSETRRFTVSNTEQKAAPRLNRDEATDLATKLKGVDLSEKQRQFLSAAVNGMSRRSRGGDDVQGYDLEVGYYIYDYSTGNYGYEVDYYDDYGDYEGSDVVEW
jgi:hypothetical protein